MSDPFNFAFEFGKAPPARQREPDQPMRILVLGNFGGRPATSGGADSSLPKIRRVDVDNFETLLSEIRPVLRIPLGSGVGITDEIAFEELDDFHPDRLYRDLPVFQHLRELRKRLRDPATFAEAAAELQRDTPGATDTTSAGMGEPDPGTETDSGTLDRLLGGSANRSASTDAAKPRADVANLIKQIVSPHIVPNPDPRQDEYVQSLDSAIASQMRAILHHDAFQSLEATWRGLHFLVSGIETSEELEVHLADVTQGELTASLKSESGQVIDADLFQHLVTQREERPWSLLVSDFSLGSEAADLSLLGRLGMLAAHAGAPLMASAANALVGMQPGNESIDQEVTDAWQSLRTSEVAAWIGLIQPKFLLRLPYGASTDPIDAFEFEEIEDPHSQQGRFLWGASSWLGATLLGTSFAESGWQMTPGDDLQCEDLPAVTYSVDGESQLKPCAEIHLPERSAEAVLACGVMPLMSFKNRNAVRLMRFQSIAHPPKPLAGPWA